MTPLVAARDAVRATLDTAGVDPCEVIAQAIVDGVFDAEVLEALGIDGLDEETAQELEDKVTEAGG